MGITSLRIATLCATLLACSVKPVAYTPPGDDGGGPTGGAPSGGPDGGMATPDGALGATATISVAVTGSGGGMVTSMPDGLACPGTCAMTVPLDTPVHLIAASAAASVFVTWQGTCGSSGDCAFIADSNAAVSAEFAAFNPLSVALAGNGHGVVTSLPGSITCGAACSDSFAPGTMVTLSASPTDDSSFAGWSSPCTGTGDCQVTLDAAQAVTATFTLLPPPQFAVTVVSAGSGTGIISGGDGSLGTCGTNCALFSAGSVVSYNAIATKGSVFAGWGGPCSGSGACTFTVTADTTLSATFAANNDLVVTFSGSGGGTVNLMPGTPCTASCDEVFAPGTLINLSATANLGSVFTGWSGGGCSGSGNCQVVLDAATAVTATFAIPQIPLTVKLAGAGGGTVTSQPAGISCGTTCNASYDVNTKVTLTATPNASSTFTGWTGACSGTGACQVTLAAMATVTASFAITQVTLMVSIGGDGDGSVASNVGGIHCSGTCGATYAIGTTVTLTATPDAGSIFIDWTSATGGATCVASGSGTCKIAMTADSTVTAHFRLDVGLCDTTPISSAVGNTTQPCVAGDDSPGTCCIAGAAELQRFYAASQAVELGHQ